MNLGKPDFEEILQDFGSTNNGLILLAVQERMSEEPMAIFPGRLLMYTSVDQTGRKELVMSETEIENAQQVDVGEASE